MFTSFAQPEYGSPFGAWGFPGHSSSRRGNRQRRLYDRNRRPTYEDQLRRSEYERLRQAQYEEQLRQAQYEEQLRQAQYEEQLRQAKLRRRQALYEEQLRRDEYEEQLRRANYSQPTYEEEEYVSDESDSEYYSDEGSVSEEPCLGKVHDFSTGRVPKGCQCTPPENLEGIVIEEVDESFRLPPHRRLPDSCPHVLELIE